MTDDRELEEKIKDFIKGTRSSFIRFPDDFLEDQSELNHPLLEIHTTLGFIKKVLYGVLVLLGSLIILNIFNLLYLLTNS